MRKKTGWDKLMEKLIPKMAEEALKREERLLELLEKNNPSPDIQRNDPSEEEREI